MGSMSQSLLCLEFDLEFSKGSIFLIRWNWIKRFFFYSKNGREMILEILSFISPLLEISRERERRIIEIAKAE